MLQSGENGLRALRRECRCCVARHSPRANYLFSATSLNALTSGFSSFPFIPQRMS
jgi:hypothetical protein